LAEKDSRPFPATVEGTVIQDLHAGQNNWLLSSPGDDLRGGF
jgi:hypothetical protein